MTLISEKFSRSGFTLVELLVVVAMIAVIMGALTTSVSGAQQRARIQKATAEVKSVSQAVMSYETRHPGELSALDDVEVGADTLGFLVGQGGDKDMPVLLMAALNGSGKMLDPWGQPYRISVKVGTVSNPTSIGSLTTGYALPNFHRLSKDERQ